MGNKCGAHTVPYIKNKKIQTLILLMKQQRSKLVKNNGIIVSKRGLNPEEVPVIV